MSENSDFSIEARYYQKETDGKISCLLCPQGCSIARERPGLCQVRFNRGNKLIAANYARITGLAVDPIEKKPLYHFYPGKFILSVGTFGCNLACEFCQNWQISKGPEPLTRLVTPDQLTALAIQAAHEEQSIGIAYTYTEPGVWFEFLMATMPLVREAGLKNVLVTNAFLEPAPWRELLTWTDAANIDLKGFDPEYYRRLCHGRLEPVLTNIKEAVGKIHLELTTLIIPGENDQPEQMDKMTKWLSGLDPEIPLHLSRYFPNFKLTKPATPIATMQSLYEIARQNLKYVYLGNLGSVTNTYCPQCGKVLIERKGFHAQVLSGPDCENCGRKTGIVLED